jgi:hypothetical protein
VPAVVDLVVDSAAVVRKHRQPRPQRPGKASR